MCAQAAAEPAQVWALSLRLSLPVDPLPQPHTSHTDLTSDLHHLNICMHMHMYMYMYMYVAHHHVSRGMDNQESWALYMYVRSCAG